MPMVSNAQKLNTSSSFTSFLKSKWRSNAKETRVRSYNSVTDIERDWVRHSALKLALKGDFQAPIEHWLKSGGCEVLDIGCSAGYWITDMATRYPISHFTGIDIDKSVFPTSGIPKNAVFQRVDLLDLPLPYENDTFDYIFIRCMVDVIPDEEWDAVLRDLVRVMKKGGYIECVEAYPDLFDAGPAMSTVMQLYQGTSPNQTQPGSPTTAVMQNPLPNRIAAINQLIGIQIQHTHTPVGRYGGAVGSLLLEHWDRIISSSKQQWLQSKLITEKQLAAVTKELREEVEVYQTYMSWYSVVAEKRGYKGPVIQVEDFDDFSGSPTVNHILG